MTRKHGNVHRRKHGNVHRRVASFAAAAALAAVAGAPALASGDQETAKQSWQGSARDAWLHGKLEASYALNRYLNPFEIDTQVDGGMVRLTGVVESQIDKDLAEQIAWDIEGVTEVRNELQVQARPRIEEPDPGARPDEGATRDFGTRVEDFTTTARVKLALLANQSTEGMKIDVDTLNGTVSLQGAVGSAQEKELAERIAKNTEGVSRVENHLKVAGHS